MLSFVMPCTLGESGAGLQNAPEGPLTVGRLAQTLAIRPTAALL